MCLNMFFFTTFNRQQKVILKTSSATPVKLQLMIEGNHSDYQVCLTESGKVFPLCNFTNELWYSKYIIAKQIEVLHDSHFFLNMCFLCISSSSITCIDSGIK